jgi:hypothetical protein
MAEPVEDKDFLAERLEEDRQKMAVQVSELKEDYNLSRWLRASMHKYPWPWVMGAVLTGFLLSRLPARRKEVYLSSDPLGSRSRREVQPPASDKNQSRTLNKIWSLVKPIIGTYIGRELYKRVRRPAKHSDRSQTDGPRKGSRFAYR